MVPNGWEHLTFAQLIKTGDITQIQDGNHGNSHPKSSDFVSSGIPFVMARDLNNGSIDLYNCVRITKEQADSLRIGFAIEGDVLISHKGTVGEVAIVPEVDDYVMLTPQVTYYRMSSSSKLLNRYLYQYFLSNNFQSRLKSLAGQSTRSYLGITAQKELYINLPPLPEQRKIAQILSIWDRGIATTEKLIDASKQQKKALMQQLLTGKKRLVDPETGKAFEGEWEEVKLGDFVTIQSGYAPSQFTLTKDEKYPYVKVEDMNNCTKYQNISREYSYKIKKTVPKGSVIFPKRGAAIMNNKVRIAAKEIYMDSNMMALTPKDKLHSEFCYYLLLKEELYRIADTSTIPQINNKHITPYPFLLPSKLEQQKIASVLTAADKEIELLQAKLAHFKQEKKALMQQLLTGKRRVSLSS